MKQSCLYQLRVSWSYLISEIIFMLVMILGCLLTNGRNETAEHLFSIYLASFPMMTGLMLFYAAFQLTGSSLNIALSMGVRRQDYFRALQLTYVVLLAVMLLFQLILDMIVIHFGWEIEEFSGVGYTWDNLVVIPIYLLSLTLGGALSGLWTWISGVKGQVLITMLATMHTLSVLMIGLFIFAPDNRGAWGDLPWILPLVSLIVSLGLDFLTRRSIRKAVV